MTEPLRTSLRASEDESPKDRIAQPNAQLMHIRAHRTQSEMAEALGVSPRTYVYWEHGQRELSAHALIVLMHMGWNANWVLSGVGPPRLAATMPAATGHQSDLSQDLSEDHLIIALELAEEAIRGTGTRKPPLLLYGRLLRLIYQGVSQGLPMAEVRSIAGEAAEAFIGTGGRHGSEQDVDSTGAGRAGGDRSRG